MSIELLAPPEAEGSEHSLEGRSDRRADVEAKQARVAGLLKKHGRDGLLLLAPENFGWITSGATARGVIDPATAPAIYCTPEARWLLASNADSQRLFDEEMEALGFQLKEWPWHWGREQLLADLCHNRKVCCDLADRMEEVPSIAADLRAERRTLTVYEQASLLAVGEVVAHALEATCRTIPKDQTEREAAAQIAHRLMHRGVVPVHIGVAADNRSRHYRRHGFTQASIERFAVMTATGRKYGLHATATRMVAFGEPSDELKHEINAVCRVSAAYIAATWPDSVPREVLAAGKRIYHLSGQEHEWLLAPQGCFTGRAPVEGHITPKTEELMQAGWAVAWQASAGSAASGDTFIVAEEGARPVTPMEAWPQKKVRIQGHEVLRPDALVR
ncbi:MAG: M24 family metallopeptidase [Gemmataceae bacterium]|nr:M24 family metallopeptidase [Gemmataceae bacterium]